MAKRYTLKAETGQFRVTGSDARLSRIRTYWERRPVLCVAVVLITLGSPFVGLMVAGLTGALIGLVLSVAGLIGGIFALTRLQVGLQSRLVGAAKR
jgi:uncharacterized oligopeptide transporter (OPT) family protein